MVSRERGGPPPKEMKFIPGSTLESQEKNKEKVSLAKYMTESSTLSIMERFGNLGDSAETKELIASPEIQEAIRAVLIREVDRRSSHAVDDLITFFKIPDAALEAKDIQEHARETCLETLRNGGYTTLFIFASKFKIDLSTLDQEELASAAKKGIEHILGRKTRPTEFAKKMRERLEEEGLSDLLE